MPRTIPMLGLQELRTPNTCSTTRCDCSHGEPRAHTTGAAWDVQSTAIGVVTAASYLGSWAAFRFSPGLIEQASWATPFEVGPTTCSVPPCTGCVALGADGVAWYAPPSGPRRSSVELALRGYHSGRSGRCRTLRIQVTLAELLWTPACRDGKGKRREMGSAKPRVRLGFNSFFSAAR